MIEELKPEQLKWTCNVNNIKFKTTSEVKVHPDIIGQPRAVNALKLGLDIESTGYNVFITGEVGTGRKTAVHRFIKETSRIKRIPDDKCYVNNFTNPDEPILIRLKTGEGRSFKKAMDSFIRYLVKEIPAVLKSKTYEQSKKKLIDEYKKKEHELSENFEEEAEKNNFTIVQVQMGPYTKPTLVPLLDGKPADLQALKMSGEKEKVAKIEKIHIQLNKKLITTIKAISKIEKELEEKLRELDLNIISPVIEHKIDELKNKYNNEQINKYLDAVKLNVIEEVDKFCNPEQELGENLFGEYRVNLLADNHGSTKAPVIFETSPTYSKLFGRVEMKFNKTGSWEADFLDIKAGSFLKADGGFLILEGYDVLTEPGVWQALKRVLKNRSLEIQNYFSHYLLADTSLKPEKIDCDVKVILIGNNFLYNLLYEYDEDFKKIFKIRADFDSTMKLDEMAINEYVNFTKKIIENEKLLEFTKDACASVIEYGVKLADKKTKVSTQFNQIADLIREANYWAIKEKSSTVSRSNVEKAKREKIERSKLVEEKIQELIEDGTIMIDTTGKIVGQVNGLAVYEMGDYSFGKPSRITAKVAIGSSGIINIEREAELSGKIHSKGVLILAGYLYSKYAQNKPLIVNASLCFEQSYSGVEGDSASSTELYALLSALSDLPLRQDIAVTGSVNQKGEVQAIGGINEKIEGFYEVCKAKGLTGTQGVMMPYQNVQNLVLKDEVIKAVADKKFHIYPIKTIDEGIELLTGTSAGKQKEDGFYEEKTVNYLADSKLQKFAEKWQAFKMGKE